MANPTLTELRDLYFYLDDNFEELEDACKTDEQKKALSKNYATARDNFQKAVALVFDEDDAEVAQITGDLQDVNKKLADMKASVAKIASILQLIAKGVDVGVKLVGLAKAG